MDERQYHQRRAADDHVVVGPGVGRRLRAGAQQAQHRPAKQQHRHGDDRAGQQREIEAERADPPDAVPVPRAQQPGDQRIAALAVDVADGHQRREQRRAQRHARHQHGVAGLRDEVRVRQVVDQRDDHAEHDRQRQPEVTGYQPVRIESALFSHLQPRYPLTVDYWLLAAGC